MWGSWNKASSARPVNAQPASLWSWPSSLQNCENSTSIVYTGKGREKPRHPLLRFPEGNNADSLGQNKPLAVYLTRCHASSATSSYESPFRYLNRKLSQKQNKPADPPFRVPFFLWPVDQRPSDYVLVHLLPVPYKVFAVPFGLHFFRCVSRVLMSFIHN